MEKSYFSPIDIDQSRLCEAALTTFDKVAYILSDQSPTLIYNKNNKRKVESFNENVKACDESVFDNTEGSPTQINTVENKDVHERQGPGDPERQDAEYLNNLIRKCIERYQEAIKFYDSLLRPMSQPRLEPPTTGSIPVEEGQPVSPPLESIQAEKDQLVSPPLESDDYNKERRPYN